MVTAACCEARTFVVDLQQASLMKLLKPHNLVACVRRACDLNASRKRIGPQHVTPVT